MNIFGELINTLNSILWSQYVLIPLLLISGIYFTVKTRFLQVRMLPTMIKSISVKCETDEDEHSISSFEAFSVGLASRVGTGNLAGVALAIVVGGPGAVFWMWIVAILGAVNSFIESTLAQLYKVPDAEVKYRGGPAYYMRDGLGSKKMGAVFAFTITIAFGLIFNAVQVNAISNAAVTALNVQENKIIFTLIIGIVLATLSAAIIFRGTKSIAKFTSKMVPIMAYSYLAIAALVIILRFNQIPTVLAMILNDAFTGDAVAGGAVGITIILGVKRGLFSNEAGMGSAPNAAAGASTDHPVRQGLVQSFGVYVDTLIICSATAFIILVSGIELDPSATDGISVTMNALTAVIGNWAIYFLLVAIFFFAFSTVLGFYYYAQTNIEFITEKPIAISIFRIALISIIIYGSVANSEIVWALADLGMGIMAILNIIAILILGRQALYLLTDFESQLKAGKNPIFDSSKHEQFKHLHLWDKSGDDN